MVARLTISTAVLFSVVSLLILGEILSGTSLAFVAMMAAIMSCIAITYNLLGGVGTFSGILFTIFSLRTIVISQFAKVILFEAADKNLEAPGLTIAVYLVFYFCVMLGVFIYGRLRLDLPKPMEPATRSQVNILYVISLVVGLVATIAFQVTLVIGGGGEKDKFGESRSFGLLFSVLLLFALVVAVDSRIRSSGGLRSFGIAASIPWTLTLLFAFFNTSRGGIIAPTIVYFATCYTRGYCFKRRHYLSAALWIFFFVFFISPFELYSRPFLADMPFWDRTYETIYLLRTVPDRATVALATQQAAESSESRDEYFSRSGTFILSRFSMIRPDSNLISACSGGFHYGWTAVKIDLLHSIPRFFYNDKPDTDSAGFVGRVSGMNPDAVDNGESAISPISDSFGAFGWMGVVIFALFAFPAIFIVFESVFDMSRPWGTVALGMLLLTFAEGGAGVYLAAIIRIPIYLVLLSYIIGGIARLLAIRGDRKIFISAKVDSESAIP
jgi:hypothetical protein